MTITVDEVKDLGICIEINKTTVKKKVRMKKIQFLIKKNLNNKQLNIFPLKYIGHRISKDNFLKAYFSCELSN